MNEDFQAGRKVESLEQQIKAIDAEIRAAQNPESMRSALSPILDQAFQEYLSIATKYGENIREVSEIYKRAKGIGEPATAHFEF